MSDPLFLTGVPADHVRKRLALAGGDELGSGKFAHPESSAVLAVNAFGWFIARPDLLPPLPGTRRAGPVRRVEVEYCARFPWAGGTHPWLDAIAITGSHLIGIESKRFEPFRDRKQPHFSATYDRPVWGDAMARYGMVRDALRARALVYRHLDAAQLVKHAYGLVTESGRLGLQPHLAYIYAEPHDRAGIVIAAEEHQRHRAEAADFADRVAGDAVSFGHASYREWLAGAGKPVRDHATALIDAFAL